MKRFWLVSLALVCAGLLTSCDKSCDSITHDTLYALKLTKPLKVSLVDPSNGSITGSRSLGAGDVIKGYHASGAAVGSGIQLKTGALVYLDDTTSSTDLLAVCNTCAEGMVEDNQAMTGGICPPISMGCSSFIVTATTAGSIWDENSHASYPIKPGDKLILCWPEGSWHPATGSGTSWGIPFDPMFLGTRPPIGGIAITIDASGQTGILETPMMVTW